MYLIIGLGNPGHKYSGTRHNVGFKVVNTLAEDLDINDTELKYKSILGRGELGQSSVVLAQPITYMNRSGIAVRKLVNNFQVDLDNILVIYDDLDLPPGKIRIKKKGGSGGHNGLQSVIDNLGTKIFPRLRIGIGRPPAGIEVVDYVLQNFCEKDKGLIDEAIQDSVKAIKLICNGSIEKAMTKYN